MSIPGPAFVCKSVLLQTIQTDNVHCCQLFHDRRELFKTVVLNNTEVDVDTTNHVTGVMCLRYNAVPALMATGTSISD